MPAQRTVPTSSQSRNSESGAPAAAASAPPLRPLIKVALLGDSQVGKTSLMNRFIEGTFDDTELQTQGVNFMEKTVSMRGHEVTFSIWDIGGHKDFESMLPLACNDAAAMLLLFDLSKPETLDRIRVWHQKARERNKFATPVLVGCKFDLMLEAPLEEQRHIVQMSHQFAKAINAPLVFCAPSVPINVTNVFKVILISLFGLEPAVPQLTRLGEPLLLYAGGELDLDSVAEPPPPPLPRSNGGASPLADVAGMAPASLRSNSFGGGHAGAEKTWGASSGASLGV
mmetsp:Transcript_13905/g.44586  ORF Transcript_13905/g.44586 Transcript_13905/m.44586 type:complete len:284 (+) Transcript_13905:96-947(+)